MSAPVNRQEVPEPHRDWVGSNEVDAAPARTLAKRARLWRPMRTLLEPMVCTLARYAHRLIDRTTGIPYSADELEAKILAQTGIGTVESLTTSDGTAAAAAGKLGEFIEDNFGPIAGLTTATSTDLGSIALTAGDWELTGYVLFVFSGADTTLRSAALSTISATLPGSGSEFTDTIPATGLTGARLELVPPRRVRISAPATIYLVARAEFTAGTVSAGGYITARRVR